MRLIKSFFLLLVVSTFALAQNSAPNNESSDMSQVLQELRQMRQAITDQQKQIAAQQQEIERLRQQQAKVNEASANPAGASAHLVNAVSTTAVADAAKPQAPSPQNPQGTTGPSTPGPTAISAVVPLRVLPVDPPKKAGLIPDITIGKKINVKPYGFFKATAIYDTSSPYGNDFPLPGFIGDINGPDKMPEFHLKARSLRLGANFEWLDPSPNVSVTGKFEMDFEGNFSRVNNRNISSIRSSMPSIRLGYGRIDWKKSDTTTLFALFGQDWTPFGSSTLPNLFESTGLGLGFGTLYERAPQVRVGVNQKIGGSDRKFAIQPEFAVVLPVFGNLPANVADQLGFAERQGPDAGRPELQARLVTQFQLDKAPGVPPAQIIVSGVNGERTAVVLASAVPAPFQPFFPSGARVTTQRWGWTGEIQLPTRFATVTAKYYNGTDLRFYFAGQLYTQFNDTLPFIPASLVEVASIDGASSLRMGLLADGTPAIAQQRPARAQGGFVNVGLPLSRWFNADPKGRNAGWTMYLHAGYDQVLARDVRRLGGGRAKSRLLSGQMQYKINDWVSFVAEESLYTTYAIPSTVGATAGSLPRIAGRQTRQWNDFRSEIGPQFTF